jgi:hypothetical protein
VARASACAVELAGATGAEVTPRAGAGALASALVHAAAADA